MVRKCPTGKVFYRSYAAAAEGLLKVAEWRLRQGHEGPREVNIYRCETCRWWHLTHQIDYRHPATKEAQR